MNAHITTPRTVSGATLARTAVLALALINQILSAAGKPLLPIDSAQLEQLISTGFTTVSALVNWWFNNSFTKEAIQADAEFERLRKSVK
ncbi:MAG: phage holin [Faecalibacterium sp.]